MFPLSASIWVKLMRQTPCKECTNSTTYIYLYTHIHSLCIALEKSVISRTDEKTQRAASSQLKSTWSMLIGLNSFHVHMLTSHSYLTYTRIHTHTQFIYVRTQFCSRAAFSLVRLRSMFVCVCVCLFIILLLLLLLSMEL